MKPVSGKRFCKAIERRGWILLRINGSHHIFGRPDSPSILPVPVHGNDDLPDRYTASLDATGGTYRRRAVIDRDHSDVGSICRRASRAKARFHLPALKGDGGQGQAVALSRSTEICGGSRLNESTGRTRLLIAPSRRLSENSICALKPGEIGEVYGRKTLAIPPILSIQILLLDSLLVPYVVLRVECLWRSNEMSEDEHVRRKDDLEARRDPVSPGNGPEVLIRPDERSGVEQKGLLERDYWCQFFFSIIGAFFGEKRTDTNNQS